MTVLTDESGNKYGMLNDGDYEYKNIQWETNAQQASNTRANVYILFRGRTMTLTEWAREMCLTTSGLASRIKKWGIDRALTESVRR